MKRNIIKINEEKCNGCGLCIPDCPEGALQLIDGKARLVSDLFCDGLGACIGNCPEGAIEIEEREAEPYDEHKVMKNIVQKGDATIKAHLEHLKNHNATEYYNQALKYLEDNRYDVSRYLPEEKVKINVCPGVLSRSFDRGGKGHSGSHSHGHGHGSHAAGADTANISSGSGASELLNWPVQLHLVNPDSPHFSGSDLLVAADCAAFVAGDFHQKYLKGKTLVIACPKLDNSADIYVEKITALIEKSRVNTITIARMEVPCCRGISAIVAEAVSRAGRKVPVKEAVIGIGGELISEEWI